MAFVANLLLVVKSGYLTSFQDPTISIVTSKSSSEITSTPSSLALQIMGPIETSQ